MKKPITILSIDDEEEICFSLNALFKLQGWRSYTAQSVETGLALFKAYQPDIVLIDYHMPRVNGVEGVRRLRNSARPCRFWCLPLTKTNRWRMPS